MIIGIAGKGGFTTSNNDCAEMIEYLKLIISELLAHTVRIKNNYHEQINQSTLIMLYNLLEAPQTLTDSDIANIQTLVIQQHEIVSKSILRITGYPLWNYF